MCPIIFYDEIYHKEVLKLSVGGWDEQTNIKYSDRLTQSLIGLFSISNQLAINEILDIFRQVPIIPQFECALAVQFTSHLLTYPLQSS